MSERPGKLGRALWRCWMAAVIDAEGAISVSPRQWSANGRTYYTLQVSVKNTSFAFLERIQQVTGLGSIRPTRNGPRCKPTWVWRATGPSAAAVLRAIKRCLVIKGEHADLALALQRTKLKLGYHQSDAILASQAAIYTRLKSLNARGQPSPTTPVEGKAEDTTTSLALA